MNVTDPLPVVRCSFSRRVGDVVFRTVRKGVRAIDADVRRTAWSVGRVVTA